MIELVDIVKTYAGPAEPVEALRGISLRVGAGEIFGIIGRSGAGKSTLIRCVNLLERPTSGRVIVDGHELTRLPPAELRAERRQIGMIFQHFNLLSSRTALENVALPLELAGADPAAARQRALPLLDLVGLSGQRDQYPAQLSGGQKQRVGIARAVASRPRLLLCDEVTSALDPESTRSILTLLRDLQHRFGLTILLITHEMAVVKEICGRVAVLEEGRVVEEAHTFGLFTRPKAEATRALLGELVGDGLPASVVKRLRAEIDSGRGRLLRVVFSGAYADRPVLTESARRFEVDFNILYGRIDEIQGAPFGSLVVLAHGAPDALDRAVRHLLSLELYVEPIDHVLATASATD
jgi:D-methionine transport system ATP-binding protein